MNRNTWKNRAKISKMLDWVESVFGIDTLLIIPDCNPSQKIDMGTFRCDVGHCGLFDAAILGRKVLCEMNFWILPQLDQSISRYAGCNGLSVEIHAYDFCLLMFAAVVAFACAPYNQKIDFHALNNVLSVLDYRLHSSHPGLWEELRPFYAG